MKNADKPAMPNNTDGSYLHNYFGMSERQILFYQEGVTKREHFAAMAMQGMVAERDCIGTKYSEDVARLAVIYADALLAELDKSDA